jgi:hypothetical protein
LPDLEVLALRCLVAPVPVLLTGHVWDDLRVG